MTGFFSHAAHVLPAPIFSGVKAPGSEGTAPLRTSPFPKIFDRVGILPGDPGLRSVSCLVMDTTCLQIGTLLSAILNYSIKHGDCEKNTDAELYLICYKMYPQRTTVPAPNPDCRPSCSLGRCRGTSSIPMHEGAWAPARGPAHCFIIVIVVR